MESQNKEETKIEGQNTEDKNNLNHLDNLNKKHKDDWIIGLWFILAIAMYFLLGIICGINIGYLGR